MVFNGASPQNAPPGIRMKQSLVVTSLVASLFGCAGAGLVLWTAAPRDASKAGAQSAAAPGDARVATTELESLSDDLATLVLENRELRTRIEALERRPVADARAAVALETDPEALKSAADGLAARGESTAVVHPATLQASVEEALEAIRANERAEVERARQARELERMEERLTRMTEQLALTPGQVNEMRAHMVAQDAARGELERQREAGIDRETYVTLRDEQRKREQANLARFLDAEQLTTLTTRNDNRDDSRGRDAGRQRGAGQRGN